MGLTTTDSRSENALTHGVVASVYSQHTHTAQSRRGEGKKQSSWRSGCHRSFLEVVRYLRPARRTLSGYTPARGNCLCLLCLQSWSNVCECVQKRAFARDVLKLLKLKLNRLS